MDTFGERLESLRKGQTQKEFASKIGLPLNSYTNWVRGIREPSMSAIISLCTHLSVSADWLLGLTGDNKNLNSAAAENRNNSPEKAADGDNSSLKSAAADFKNNSPEKAVESEGKTASEGSLKAPWKGADCATCKYRLFAEAFKALQSPV